MFVSDKTKGRKILENLQSNLVNILVPYRIASDLDEHLRRNQHEKRDTGTTVSTGC